VGGSETTVRPPPRNSRSSAGKGGAGPLPEAEVFPVSAAMERSTAAIFPWRPHSRRMVQRRRGPASITGPERTLLLAAIWVSLYAARERYLPFRLPVIRVFRSYMSHRMELRQLKLEILCDSVNCPKRRTSHRRRFRFSPTLARWRALVSNWPHPFRSSGRRSNRPVRGSDRRVLLPDRACGYGATTDRDSVVTSTCTRRLFCTTTW